jgi:hypothetical protein
MLPIIRVFDEKRQIAFPTVPAQPLLSLFQTLPKQLGGIHSKKATNLPRPSGTGDVDFSHKAANHIQPDKK